MEYMPLLYRIYYNKNIKFISQMRSDRSKINDFACIYCSRDFNSPTFLLTSSIAALISLLPTGRRFG